MPDEFEHTLVEALEEENFFRSIATVIQTSSGDRKISVVATKGMASWIDEEGAYLKSDDSLGQVSIGAYKEATMLKVSDELLNDSVFNLEAYISKEFGSRIGTKEEEAFFTGDGKGKPTGIFNATGGASDGVTTAAANITFDDVIYDGDLELALIPESFRTDVLKEEADTNEVLVENANSETGAFALLFEFGGDIRKIRHVLYNCSVSRPKVEGKTNEESREVQTETLTVEARPLASGYVKAKTGNRTSAETYENWYKNVYMPTPKAEAGGGADEGQG